MHRRQARVSSLFRSFIGSEGTLGIVTQATLRLAPKLPTRVAVVSFGDDVESAVRASTEVVNAGVPVREFPAGPNPDFSDAWH